MYTREAKMSADDPLISTINSHLFWWPVAYYVWVFLFYVMVLLTIVLPGLIAADIIPTAWTRRVAGISAVLVAIAAWARLDVVSTNFDVARSDLNRAMITYYGDHGKLEASLETTEKAVSAFRPGLPEEAKPKSGG
jgi:hypothetical protein